MYLYGDAFSSLRPKERIWDCSLSERIQKLASDVSYTKTTEYINDFLHRDESNSLRVKTVEEFVERMEHNVIPTRPPLTHSCRRQTLTLAVMS